MSYLTVCNITKKMGQKTVLDNINLQVEKGQFITLLGPSGCGKSTLLRCITGLEQIDQGEIFLEGIDMTHVKPAQRGMGMVFQQYSLFPTKTVYENVAFGLKLKKIAHETIKKEVYDLLALVELESAAQKFPSQLSGGEQQRIALARSLIVKPETMLFDEPLSAIDAKLRKELQIKIKMIHEQLKLTSIFVTHDQQEAMQLSDIIYVMNKGKIEQFGTPKELYNHPKNLFIAQFIGDYNIFSKEVCESIFNLDIKGRYLAISPENIIVGCELINMGTAKIIDIIFCGTHERLLLSYHGVLIKCNISNSLPCEYIKNQQVAVFIDFENGVILPN